MATGRVPTTANSPLTAKGDLFGYSTAPARLAVGNDGEQIKLWRNAELSRTDWTMHTDAPTDKVAWAAYRQALRDLPAQGGKADDVEFPTAP
jgi:hypothetical protein